MRVNKLIAIIAIVILCFVEATAQTYSHKIEIRPGSLNDYGVLAFGSMLLNIWCDDFLFDYGAEYTYYKGKDSNLVHDGGNSFDEIKFGYKLNCVYERSKLVNWGYYGSIYYKTLNMNIYRYISEEKKHRLHEAQIGGGVVMNLGSIESPLHITINAGLIYDQPFAYSGPLDGGASSIFKSGLSSHYSITFKGTRYFHDIGIYVDVPHHNIFKNNVGYDVRAKSIGFTMAIGPWVKYSDSDD